MYVASDLPPLLECCRGDGARPVGGDLAGSPDQQDEEEAEAEDVARVHPRRVKRRIEEVCETSGCRENTRNSEPAAELVTRDAVAARETVGGKGVQQREGDLRRKKERMPDDFRARAACDGRQAYRAR